jgi:hypothetical protein
MRGVNTVVWCSVRALSGAFDDGRRQLRAVDPDKMGFCSFGQKASYVQLMAIVLPQYLCLSRIGRVRPNPIATLGFGALCSTTRGSVSCV